jgi:AP-3 complex subunit beta
VNRTLILLARYVLTLARYDEDWDVRDRGRVLGSLLVGVVAGVVSSNEEEGTGEHWVNEEQEGRPGGVVLRREQVMRVLFEGKTGTIEEEAIVGECLFFLFLLLQDPPVIPFLYILNVCPPSLPADPNPP